MTPVLLNISPSEVAAGPPPHWCCSAAGLQGWADRGPADRGPAGSPAGVGGKQSSLGAVGMP